MVLDYEIQFSWVLSHLQLRVRRHTHTQIGVCDGYLEVCFSEGWRSRGRDAGCLLVSSMEVEDVVGVQIV